MLGTQGSGGKVLFFCSRIETEHLSTTFISFLAAPVNPLDTSQQECAHHRTQSGTSNGLNDTLEVKVRWYNTKGEAHT